MMVVIASKGTNIKFCVKRQKSISAWNVLTFKINFKTDKTANILKQTRAPPKSESKTIVFKEINNQRSRPTQIIDRNKASLASHNRYLKVKIIIL